MKRRALARESAAVLVLQICRVAAQAFFFVAIARELGAAEFGRFAAAAAIVAFVAPFSGMGVGSVMLQDVSRSPGLLRERWSTAVSSTVALGVPFVLVATLVGAAVLPKVGLAVLFPVAIAELIFARIVDCASQAFQGRGATATAAAVGGLAVASRAIAAAAYVVAVSNGSAAEWALYFCASSAIAGAVAVALVWFVLGCRPAPRRMVVSELRDGFHFALAQSASNVYSDADKALLARLATTEITGLYAAAYRATSLAFAPLQAVLFSSYRRFFQRGAEGLDASRRFALVLAKPMLIYATAVSAVIFLAAPWASLVLGADFEQAEEMLRWLALLPVLQTVFYLAGDALTGAGFQQLRSRIQLAAAVLNVTLNLLLIPAMGWRGAVVATWASFALLALACGLAVAVLRSRKPQPPAPTSEGAFR